MNTDTTRQDTLPGTLSYGYDAPADRASQQTKAYERAVNIILDDCFISVGQAIGLRATVDYDAVVWIRAHFRQKFLAALSHQGDRWQQDRAVVGAVAGLFAERAVRYANGAASVSVDNARQAAADVERYCQAHARRAAASTRGSDGATALIAGYWCTWDPK